MVSSSTPAVFGEPVTFTATVAGVAPGGGFGSGVVTFKRDGVVIGTGLLNTSGQATYTTTFGQLPLGSGFVITAEFAGDNNLNASTGSTTQDVISSATTTTVASTANPAVYGQPVTFSATVTPVAPGSGFPSGTVTFTLGAVTLGTAPLDANGIASYTTTLGQLPVGSGQVVTATYGGNAGFTGSVGTISETVNKDATTDTITASANPSGVEQSVTFTATIAAAAPGSGDPTGTVTFLLNGNFLGTGTLSTVGGVTTATFTAGANTLPQGLLTITANYSGDGNFLGQLERDRPHRPSWYHNHRGFIGESVVLRPVGDIHRDRGSSLSRYDANGERHLPGGWRGDRRQSGDPHERHRDVLDLVARDRQSRHHRHL